MKKTDNENKTVSQSKVSEFFKKTGSAFLNVGKTLWRWTKRTFMGASKDVANDFSVEAIDSPGKLAVKSFFSRKLAVIALVVLIALFLFVFIGPLVVPIDLVGDNRQANVAPNYSMMSVPSALKNDIKTISGVGSFTIGLSNSGKLYMWGDTDNRLFSIDYSDFPEELDGATISFASAGDSHIAVITSDGKLVMWGDKTQGQYGAVSAESGILPEPSHLIDGTIDVNNVAQLVCGINATAIVYKDGTVDIWGNSGTYKNISGVSSLTGVKKIVFSRSVAIALLESGEVTACGDETFSLSAINAVGAVDVAATNDALAAVLKNGSVEVTGAFVYNENEVPSTDTGEKFVSVSGGSSHFLAVTDQGKVYSWGNDFYSQASVNGYEGADAVYAGCNQSYVVKDGKLVKTFGLKGFLMGTDGKGRDTFARIVHGGKMTMTIGAVAVIISTVIAIIVGCVSGYFGGWVDMILMRITEIFSAIPFLPFAMMLSTVMRFLPVSETGRIFIIMCILGVLSWTGLARMIRGQVLAEREKEFVIAAKAMGVKEGRIAFKHILPNIISVIIVSVTLDFAGCMLTESSLSYLGFGVKDPQPTWGNMLDGSNNERVIQNYWWQWVFPALFLGIATICVNIIGDTLRDVMDPKSTKEK